MRSARALAAVAASPAINPAMSPLASDFCFFTAATFVSLMTILLRVLKEA
jgi:hypothetical protein